MKRNTYLALSLGTAVLLTLLLVMAIGAQAPDHADSATIFVPVDYPTIQQAIDAAAEGDTIMVRIGLYDGNLFIDKGITLTGGWNDDFTARNVPADPSVILGNQMRRNITVSTTMSDTVVTIDGFKIKDGNATGQGGSPLPNSLPAEILHNSHKTDAENLAPPEDLTPAEHLTRLETSLASVVERGLYPGGTAAYQDTVERANGYFTHLEETPPQPHSAAESSQDSADCGGAIYSSNASLHLLNSVIEGNLASLTNSGLGGGVCVNGSAPSGTRIAGNIFRSNIASAASDTPGVGMIFGYGGGLYLTYAPGALVEDNTFEGNIASNGSGGSDALTIGQGGALYVYESDNVMIRGNELRRNTASHGWHAFHGGGGGAFLYWADGATIVDNLFIENMAALHSMCDGGGLLTLLSDDVLIDGNEFTKNWACLVGTDAADNRGGGIMVVTFDRVTVTNNTLFQNTTAVSGPNIGTSLGGGLNVEDGRDARISGNTFQSNVACQTGVGYGGGMSLWGVSDSLVADNIFLDNVASLSGARGGGGGLLLRIAQFSTVRNNHFQGNLGVAEGEGIGGGGVNISFDQFYNPSVNITVEANSFIDNADSADPSRPSLGGGACFARSDGFTFTNNVAAGNTGALGSALFLGQTRFTDVANNTLVGNSGASAVFISPLNDPPIAFTNNIVVSHTVGISIAEGTVATVSYTLWDGNDTNIGGAGTITQTNPVSAEPSFVDPSNHDYHLTIGSAAINAGDPAGVPPAPPTDLDSVARPQGTAVDIGAYEWPGYWQHLPVVAKAPRLGIGASDFIFYENFDGDWPGWTKSVDTHYCPDHCDEWEWNKSWDIDYDGDGDARINCHLKNEDWDGDDEVTSSCKSHLHSPEFDAGACSDVILYIDEKYDFAKDFDWGPNCSHAVGATTIKNDSGWHFIKSYDPNVSSNGYEIGNAYDISDWAAGKNGLVLSFDAEGSVHHGSFFLLPRYLNSMTEDCGDASFNAFRRIDNVKVKCLQAQPDGTISIGDKFNYVGRGIYNTYDGQTIYKSVEPGETVVFDTQWWNDGNYDSDDIVITGTSAWPFRYYNGSIDITDELINYGWTAKNVTGGQTSIRAELTVDSSLSFGDSFWLLVRGTSTHDSSKTDTVRAILTVGGEQLSVEIGSINEGASGRVTSNPAGIDCTDSCQAEFAPGTEVTLTAFPGPGFVFHYWTSEYGACDSYEPSITVTMDADKTCEAYFSRPVIVTPDAGPGGTITPSEPTKVLIGSETFWQVTPDAGYQIADVSITHGADTACWLVSTTDPNTYRIEVPNHPYAWECTLSATFDSQAAETAD